MSERPQFERVQTEIGWTLIARGELDLAVAEDFGKHLDASLASGRGAVDLSEVTFMDSSCLASLVTAKKRAGAEADVVLIRPSTPVRRVLDLTALNGQFQLVD